MTLKEAEGQVGHIDDTPFGQPLRYPRAQSSGAVRTGNLPDDGRLFAYHFVDAGVLAGTRPLIDVTEDDTDTGATTDGRLDLEVGTEQLGPFSHAEQAQLSVSRGVTRGARKAAAIVRHAQFDVFVSKLDRYLRVAFSRVLFRVPQGLLSDSEKDEFCFRRKPSSVSNDFNGGVHNSSPRCFACNPFDRRQ